MLRRIFGFGICLGPLTFYSIRNGGSYKNLVIICLWATALACVGFAVFIFNTAANSIDSTVLTLLKIGVVIIVSHHVILDASYWSYTFKPPNKALLTLYEDKPPQFSAFIEERKRGNLSFI